MLPNNGTRTESGSLRPSGRTNSKARARPGTRCTNPFFSIRQRCCRTALGLLILKWSAASRSVGTIPVCRWRSLKNASTCLCLAVSRGVRSIDQIILYIFTVFKAFLRNLGTEPVIHAVALVRTVNRAELRHRRGDSAPAGVERSAATARSAECPSCRNCPASCIEPQRAAQIL